MGATDKYQARLLADPETFGSVILTIALSKYKEDTFNKDSMALILDLEDDFRVKMPEEGENKLKAMLLATHTQIFQQDPEAFRGICLTLWSGDPQIEYAEPLTLIEIIWAIFEVRSCHGNEIELSPGIQALISQATEDEAGDPESQEDPYGHVREALQERYTAWQDQMVGLGAQAQDMPVLEG